jgi:hypothetical protein
MARIEGHEGRWRTFPVFLGIAFLPAIRLIQMILTNDSPKHGLTN